MYKSFAGKRVLFFTLITLFFTNSFFAQTDIYNSDKTDSIVNFLKELTENQIDKLSKDYYSQKKKIFKSRLQVLTEYVKDSNYVYDRKLQSDFNKILQNILDANPELKKEKMYFFFDRSYIPNAYTYGDGSFAFNLGLFDYLESDDEIAFVICHEIAHFIKNDVNLSIEKYVKDFNSDDLKEKVRDIKKQKYGQTKAALELYKVLSFDMFRYSREKEKEADEMGYLLLKNTQYNPNASVNALKKLGTLEEIIFNDSVNIRTFFDFSEYPFDQRWIRQEKTLFSTDEPIDDYKFDKDSIRTHPYAKERVTNLASKFSIDTLSIGHTKNVYFDFKNNSERVLFRSLYDHKNYDILLYFLLKNQLKNPESIDYDLIANLLINVYEGKKNHTFGKKVRLSNPFSKEKYLDEINLFLRNLELSEISNITYYYAEKYKEYLIPETYIKIQNSFKPVTK